MDPVTHVLSGALLARAAYPVRSNQLPSRIYLIVVSVTAVFPDIDVVLRLVDTLTYLSWHQGPTHSLVLLPVWAGSLSLLLARFSKHRYTWQLFYMPACLGLGIHIAGDFVTAYGVMLFAPFSFARFSLPLVFVVDLWFSAIILAGLIMSVILPEKRRYAIMALTGLAGYLCFSWILHGQGRHVATEYAVENKLNPYAINVLPQPLSPFYRMLIVDEGTGLRVALVNLGPDIVRKSSFPGSLLNEMVSAYQPVASASWQRYGLMVSGSVEDELIVRGAWQQPVFLRFRQFAQFPIMDGIDYTARGMCVWFFDLRFKFPGLPPSFRYAVCREDAISPWYVQRQRGTFWID